MHWKETGGVEKLFALPGRLLHGQPLFKTYQRNLTARPAEDENVSKKKTESESSVVPRTQPLSLPRCEVGMHQISGRPDIRYSAFGLAGHPAKTVSGASLL
jgi:hypothetical protein